MGAVVSLELEKAARQRAQKGAAREPGYERKPVDHFSRLQGQFEGTICPQQAAREFAVVQANLGRHFSQLPAYGLQSAAVYMGLVAAATATAALILHQSQILLAHALRLSTGGTLTVEIGKCSVRHRTENFGERT
jgi:hypothetical protein